MLILYIKLKKARRSLEVFLYITAVKAAKKGTWKEGFKNFGKSLGLGLAGAAVGYAVDEGSNWVENKIEGKTGEIMKELNDSDNNDTVGNANYMGIIANS